MKEGRLKKSLEIFEEDFRGRHCFTRRLPCKAGSADVSCFWNQKHSTSCKTKKQQRYLRKTLEEDTASHAVYPAEQGRRIFDPRDMTILQNHKILFLNIDLFLKFVYASGTCGHL